MTFYPTIYVSTQGFALDIFQRIMDKSKTFFIYYFTEKDNAKPKRHKRIFKDS